MSNTSKVLKDDVSIVLCGEAGQGIQTVEHILTRTLKASGYNLFATKEFMSRIRGGSNSTTIRVSSGPVRGYSKSMHLLIPLARGAVDHVRDRLDPETIVIGERSIFEGEYEGENGLEVPLSGIASRVGGAIYQNTVAAAVLCRLFGVEEEVLQDYLRGRSVVVGCPKFDDARAYLDKFKQIFAVNDIERVMLLHMEVPCCFGLKQLVDRAVQTSGKDIEVEEVIVSVEGKRL